VGCGRSKLEFLNSKSHSCQISSKLYVGLGADARSDGHRCDFGEICENSLNVIRFSWI